MRTPRCFGTALLIITAMLIFNGSAHSQQLKLSLEEVAQHADLIFIGTVADQSSRVNDAQTMIFTDVFLRDIRVIHATKNSVQKGSSEIRLTYAGGHAGTLSVEVGDAPALVAGHRYLIFMTDDGQTYANPIVGGAQGLFEVLKDEASQEEYLQTGSGKAIVGVDDKGLHLSSKRVTGIKAGKMISDEAQVTASDGFFNEAATPANPQDSSSVSNPNLAAEGQTTPLKLNSFLDFVTGVSLNKKITNDRLKRDKVGVFYRRSGDEMVAEPLQLQHREPVKLPLNENKFLSSSSPLSINAGGNIQPEGGAVGACGYQNLFINMEQVATSSSFYSVVNDNLFTWNQFMDIYRVLPDDGSWGNNSTNEFGGFADSSSLQSVYGYSWSPGSLAVTITYADSTQQCGRIFQTDVFWNPSESWTNDPNFAVGNSGVFLMRPVNQHETGHVWGNQRGPYTETYDYDVPTVMQGYNSGVYEDGWGIHRADAYLIRRQYQSQTAILGTRDVGVESYYALNGLNSSTLDTYSYAPGQSINMHNVTVENMSYAAVSDLRLRFFLSTDRTISTDDYQMGNYWFWTTFGGETYNVGDYSTTIPTGIPGGQYYICALVTINGFGNDDYTYNNATSFFYRITVSGATSSGGGAAGLYNPSSSTFFLRNANSTGVANVTFPYGPSGAGWTPLSGDWNGDGVDTVGLYNPSTSTFFLRNSNSAGSADLVFSYGPAGAGWKPIIGDWDGNGTDTVGLYNPSTSMFFLKNTNAGGSADLVFSYGPAGAGWTPLAGDWNGDGIKTIGLYNPSSSMFFLKNTNTGGSADLVFSYGPAGGAWKPMSGDWNNDGVDTIGLYNPATSTFFLRNFNAGGSADITFSYGPAQAGWLPLGGNWDGI